MGSDLIGDRLNPPEAEAEAEADTYTLVTPTWPLGPALESASRPVEPGCAVEVRNESGRAIRLYAIPDDLGGGSPRGTGRAILDALRERDAARAELVRFVESVATAAGFDRAIVPSPSTNALLDTIKAACVERGRHRDAAANAVSRWMEAAEEEHGHRLAAEAGRDAALARCGRLESLLTSLADRLDYLQGLWGKEAITQRVVDAIQCELISLGTTDAKEGADGA